MQKTTIDDLDRKILYALIRDARTPFLEIARSCKISGAAIHQRVHRLEEAGIITGSRLLVKPEALGLDVCAFVLISVSQGDKMAAVVESLNLIPEIVECHFVTGKYTLLAKLFCRNNEHLLDVLVRQMQKIPFIETTETLMSLQQPIERHIGIDEG